MISVDVSFGFNTKTKNCPNKVILIVRNLFYVSRQETSCCATTHVGGEVHLLKKEKRAKLIPMILS